MSSVENFVAAMRANPLDEATRLIFADWLEETRPDGWEWSRKALRDGKIPLTGIDTLCLGWLGGCTFLPGSFDKRFVRSVSLVAGMERPTLTPKQYALLWKMAHRYRRQIKSQTILSIAAELHGSTPKSKRIEVTDGLFDA